MLSPLLRSQDTSMLESCAAELRAADPAARLRFWSHMPSKAIAELIKMSRANSNPSKMPMDAVLDRIEMLNRSLAAFWRSAHGWAPTAAADLLSNSRLEWQVSLSAALRLWTKKGDLSDGELILAWANLGALMEGTLKLLLAVYLEDYRAGTDALKKANAFDHKKLIAKSPDGLVLENLRVYVKNRELIGDEGDELISLIQQRRNAIHAFKNRPLGDTDEFRSAVRGYLGVLRSVNERLPYPDEIYKPREA